MAGCPAKAPPLRQLEDPVCGMGGFGAGCFGTDLGGIVDLVGFRAALPSSLTTATSAQLMNVS